MEPIEGKYGRILENWMEKHRWFLWAGCLLVIVGMVLIARLMPSNGPEVVRDELNKAGYSVENIEFALISKEDIFAGKGSIYRSSEPIEYKRGIFVDTWELQHIPFTTTRTIFVVTPYPEPPKETVLQISVAEDMVEMMEEKAVGQPIEEWVENLIERELQQKE